MKRHILSLIALLTLSAPALGQHEVFSDWDKDNDNLIEHWEFTSIFMDEYLDGWIEETDETLNEDEFFSEEYAALDTDGDNMLSDEEWIVGYNFLYGDYVAVPTVNTVDIDGDGLVEYSEYYDALYSTEYFDGIDTDNDNYISKYEVADYVFDHWDIDDNRVLSRYEYNRLDWYYLDV